MNGTVTVREASLDSVAPPSIRNGTIASSTVTDAIVISSRCGFVTRIRISPGRNSTRRMSSSSAAGCDDRHEQQQRPERPDAPAAGFRRRFGPRDHSRTSK
jgi:hypothetical protein